MSASVQADYGHYRAQYNDKSTVKQIVATDSGTFDAVIAPKNANYAIFVQRIIFNVTTDAAQTLTFQDGAGTPKVVGKSASSPGLGIEIVADYGPKGVQLTIGEELDIVISGAGLAGQISIEAYEALAQTISYLAGASLQ